jgi:hypothetical protein
MSWTPRPPPAHEVAKMRTFPGCILTDLLVDWSALIS